MAKKLTSNKAKEILHDKSVHGHPLTDKQRKFFGAIAGGAKPYKAQGGKNVTIDNWEYNTSDPVYKWMYNNDGIGYIDNKGNLVSSKTTLPEVVVWKKDKDTQKFYDNLPDSKRYAFEQMTKKYGPVNIRTDDNSGIFSGTAGHYNPFTNQITLSSKLDSSRERFGTYLSELAHKVQFDKQGKFDVIGDWTFNDFPTYIQKGYQKLRGEEFPITPYEKEGTVEHEAHSLYEPKLYNEAYDYIEEDQRHKNYNKYKTGGWLDKYEDGNTLQKKGDNYGVQGNYNDYSISVPEGFVGMGNNLQGRNYSPAWGGQFENGGMLQPPMAGANQNVPMYAMGGSIPGSVGFTYARTQSPAPSEGPYAKKTMPSAQKGELIERPIELNLPTYEPPKPFLTGFGYGFSPEANVNIYGVGAYGEANVSPRLTLSGDVSSQSLLYPGGSEMFMKPNYNVGLKYRFDNGGSMSYYQHGLDWTPRNISRNGSDIPKNQNAEYIIPKYTMPRAGSESTKINRVDEADLRQMQINKTRDSQGEIKKAPKERSITSKALAIASHPMTALKYKIHGQDIPENFEKGERNPLDYAIDVVNPAGIAEAASSIPGNISKGEYLQAGLNLLSVLPLASEFARTPLAKAAAKVAHDIPRAESIKEAIGRVGGIPLKKDIPRMAAQDVKALRQVQELSRMKDTGSKLSDLWKSAIEKNLPEEHFQKMFGKSREEVKNLLNKDLNETLPEISSPPGSGISTGRFNLRRETLPSVVNSDINVTGITEEDISRIVENTERQAQRDAMRARFRQLDAEDEELVTPTTRSNPIRDLVRDEGYDINELVRTSSPEEISEFARSMGATEDDVYDAYINPVNTQIDIARDIYTSSDRSDRVQQLLDNLRNVQQQSSHSNIIIPEQGSSRRSLVQTLNDDFSRYVDRKQPTSQIIRNKANKLLGKYTQNYPYYSGEVIEKVPNLFLNEQGSLKDVSKKVGFAPEGIRSGDIFTGSMNTSHSSYLPQLKQVFKYTKGDPQFLGYKPMNYAGYLTRAGYSSEDIAKYLNSEIDEQIKRGIIPKDVSRPFQKGEHVILPHYGIKQHKKGGNIVRDDNGYWNRDNWGKKVEINSPNITMEGVYEPLIGKSKQTGEEKLMIPGENYTFANTKQVIEKPLTKKSKTGWLDKYE